MTAADRILLHALLGDGSAASSAASAWLDATALDRLNEGRRRLLPLLRHRMHEWQLVHPAKPAIDRVHREFWLRDQRLHFQAGAVLRALAPLDAPVIVLKGLLLGRLYYPATVCRPAADIDLLVHPGHVQRVAAVLERLGYAPEPGSCLHSRTYERADGSQVDLHWSPYHEAFARDLVYPLFGRLAPLDWPESPKLYRLGHEDQLLHTMAHGLRRNAVVPIRWVVDAVLQLRRCGAEMDWELFLREGARLEVTEVARRGTMVIEEIAPGLVPSEVVQQLRGQHTRRAERLYRLDREADGPSALWARLRRNGPLPYRLGLFLLLYLRQVRGRGLCWAAGRMRARIQDLLR
jgi:hypothetical protein